MAGQMFSSWMTKPTGGVTNKDLTEAQITERDRSNPMGGYGFMTAAEKNQIAQQQAMQQQLMQQQQDYAVAQLSPTQQVNMQMAQTGRGLGMGIANMMQGRQAPQPAQDDPVLARFNQLTAQLGDPSLAKVQLGQELVQQGSPAGPQMIMDGQKELADKKKAGSEQTNLDLGIAQKIAEAPTWGYEHKPGFTDEMDQEGPDGVPGVVKRELLANTPDGSVWKIGKWAPKGSVTDTASGFKSKTDKSKTIVDFEAAQSATANYYDVIDAISEIPGDAGTWAGDAVTKVGNVTSGLSALAKQFTGRDTKLVYDDSRTNATTASIDKYDSLFQELKINNVKERALVYELAYAQVAIEQGAGARPTDSDFKSALREVGGSVGDPKSRKALLAQLKTRAMSRLENMGKYSTVDGKPVGDMYGPQLEGLRSRAKPKEASPAGLTPDEQAELEALRLRLGR